MEERKDFFYPQFAGVILHGREAMVAGHATSSVRKQRTVKVGAHFAFFFCSAQNPSPRDDTDQSMCVFSPQLTQPRNSFMNMYKGLYPG